MRQYAISLADALAEGEGHSNRGLAMIPAGQRDAEALCAFLVAHGAKATPSEDGMKIVVRTRTRREADRLQFALVCHIAATSYGNEAAWYAENAAATVLEPC